MTAVALVGCGGATPYDYFRAKTPELANGACPCRSAEEGIDPGSSGHMPYSIITKSPIRSLEGVVFDALGAPVENALVEVFNHPERSFWYGLVEVGEQGPQKRLAGCWTGPTGCYQFRGLPGGDYDLRVRAAGFDPAYFWVTVHPNASVQNRMLAVDLRLAN